MRVLFDEAHSEAWTIRPDLAAEMQPSHPGDSSLAAAAEALARHDFAVAAHSAGPLNRDSLDAADVLVIAHPSEPKWEATTGAGAPRLEAEEIAAIEAFVRGGGGLVVLAETENDKYGNNLNELLGRFGIGVANATVQDYEHNMHETPSWVLAELGDGNGSTPDLLARVERACFYRAGALELANGAIPIARAHSTASSPGAALAAVAPAGEGRVVVLADSDLFGDDCLDELDHRNLWLNLIYWAAGAAFARPVEAPASAAFADPAWGELKGAVAELRLMQEPDGSAAAGADRDRLRDLSVAIAAGARRLEPHFPHQHDYIEALAGDLAAWADQGFGKPAFDASSEALRPDRDRRDGIEHLVVLPMYKQNASRDICFEALIVRGPWPEWIAEIEGAL